jgi:hypothetical protein
MQYRIAIDPGMSGVGFAVWNHGHFVKVATISPKGPDHLAKLKDLQVKLNKFYLGLLAEGGPGSFIEIIVIEEWEKFIPRCKVSSMLKSAEGRGLLIGVSCSYCDDIRFIGKGKVGKGEAQMLAQHAGINGSAHARDAAHLGLLAGFF